MFGGKDYKRKTREDLQFMLYRVDVAWIRVGKNALGIDGVYQLRWGEAVQQNASGHDSNRRGSQLKKR
jgi:hypothetical protein